MADERPVVTIADPEAWAAEQVRRAAKVQPLRYCPICEANVVTDDHGNHRTGWCGGTYGYRPGKRDDFETPTPLAPKEPSDAR